MKLNHILHLLVCLLSLAYGDVSAQQSPGSLQNNGYAYLENFNSSMAMVIVFLVCAFFLVGFFSIYIRRCAETHIANGGGSLGAAAAAIGVSARRKGVDPAVIEKFPIFVYSDVKDLKIGKGALECAVCLSEFEDYETLRLLPKCDHVFHPDCIDAWLASHITCPVCRAKLAPESNHRVSEPSNDSNQPETSGANEIGDQQQQNEAVVVNVCENQSREAVEIENRPARSGIFGKFPRSHSTGHSLVQPGENTERYTLRLPDSVRRQLVSSRNNKLKRSTSYDVILPRLGSSRKGYRSGGEGSSSRGKTSADNQTGRFDPWVLMRTPPFIGRGGSVKSSKNGVDGDGLYGKPLLTSVKMPLDCLNVKADRSQEPISRPPV